MSGARVESPWFTAEEAAAYLRIETTSDKGSKLHAFYLAYRRMGIPAYRFRGGRELRFRQADLDAALETARVEVSSPAERSASVSQPHRGIRGEGFRQVAKR